MFLSSYPGDPTTPGYPAYEDAERKDATNIPRIPSLPISWHNAQRLLEEIGHSVLEQNNLTGKISNSTIRIVNHGMRAGPFFETVTMTLVCSG